MDLSLLDIKSDKATPATAFTARLACDGVPKVTIVKTHEAAWPELGYVKGQADAADCYVKAEDLAKSLKFEHLHAYILHLYATDMSKRAANAAAIEQERQLRKLCNEALLIKLPRHQEGEYMASYEAPNVVIQNGKKVISIKGKVGSAAHRQSIEEMFAELGVTGITYYNDIYEQSQGQLL